MRLCFWLSQSVCLEGDRIEIYIRELLKMMGLVYVDRDGTEIS